jgi:hypothetical protein
MQIVQLCGLKPPRRACSSLCRWRVAKTVMNREWEIQRQLSNSSVCIHVTIRLSQNVQNVASSHISYQTHVYEPLPLALALAQGHCAPPPNNMDAA